MPRQCFHECFHTSLLRKLLNRRLEGKLFNLAQSCWKDPSAKRQSSDSRAPLGSSSKASEQSRSVRIKERQRGSPRLEKDWVLLDMFARFRMASARMELERVGVNNVGWDGVG